MRRQVWTLSGLILAILAGCHSSADIDGEWNVTLSLSSGGGVVDESFPGRLELGQFFNSVEGTGYVAGSDCQMTFTVNGFAHDPYHIPLEFDFTGGNCQDSPFEDNLLVNMTMLDEGRVLYGHNGYSDQILYVSASATPY